MYLAAVHLPLYVAHGHTRRELLRQAPLAAGVSVLVLAAGMTLGYGLERLVYSAAGRRRRSSRSTLFETPDTYGPIFLEFVLLFSVWTSAGAMVGAASAWRSRSWRPAR